MRTLAVIFLLTASLSVEALMPFSAFQTKLNQQVDDFVKVALTEDTIDADDLRKAIVDLIFEDPFSKNYSEGLKLLEAKSKSSPEIELLKVAIIKKYDGIFPFRLAKEQSTRTQNFAMGGAILGVGGYGLSCFLRPHQLNRYTRLMRALERFKWIQFYIPVAGIGLGHGSAKAVNSVRIFDTKAPPRPETFFNLDSAEPEIVMESAEAIDRELIGMYSDFIAIPPAFYLARKATAGLKALVPDDIRCAKLYASLARAVETGPIVRHFTKTARRLRIPLNPAEIYLSFLFTAKLSEATEKGWNYVSDYNPKRNTFIAAVQRVRDASSRGIKIEIEIAVSELARKAGLFYDHLEAGRMKAIADFSKSALQLAASTQDETSEEEIKAELNRLRGIRDAAILKMVSVEDERLFFEYLKHMQQNNFSDDETLLSRFKGKAPEHAGLVFLYAAAVLRSLNLNDRYLMRQAEQYSENHLSISVFKGAK